MHFHELITPLKEEEFFDDFFEKKHFLSKKKGRFVTPPFSSLELFSALRNWNFGFPRVSLSKDGREIEPDFFTKDVHIGGYAEKLTDGHRVLREFKSGATIILQGLHYWHSETAQFCRDLLNETLFRFNVTLYCSPVSSPGFSRHFDTHDNFIIQLEGKKTWKLFEAPLRVPNSNLPHSGYDLSTAKHIDTLVLEQGDILYVPRGLVHEVSADTEQSLHFTLGFKTITIFDVLNLLANNAECEELRQTLTVDVEGTNFENSYDKIIEALSSQHYKNRVSSLFPLLKFKTIEGIPSFSEPYNSNLNKLFLNKKIPYKIQENGRTCYFYVADTVLELTPKQKHLFFSIKEKGLVNLLDLPEDDEQTEFVNQLKYLGMLH